MLLELREISCATPIVTSSDNLEDNFCLTMSTVKGGCSRDVLLYTFNTGVFKCVNKPYRSKNISTTIKTYLKWICELDWQSWYYFRHNDRWNLLQTVPVVDMEGTVTRAGLRCSRNYSTPGICSLIKTTDTEKNDAISSQISTIMIYFLDKIITTDTQKHLSLKIWYRGHMAPLSKWYAVYTLYRILNRIQCCIIYGTDI